MCTLRFWFGGAVSKFIFFRYSSRGPRRGQWKLTESQGGPGVLQAAVVWGSAITGSRVGPRRPLRAASANASGEIWMGRKDFVAREPRPKPMVLGVTVNPAQLFGVFKRPWDLPNHQMVNIKLRTPDLEEFGWAGRVCGAGTPARELLRLHRRTGVSAPQIERHSRSGEVVPRPAHLR